MSKKKPLEVGQVVWLETVSSIVGGEVKKELEKMVVVKANKSSAYIWYNDDSNVHYRVNQKTHDVKYAIPTGRIYRLWLSKEEYEEDKVYKKESEELRNKLHNTIDVMTLSQLKSLNSLLFDKK